MIWLRQSISFPLHTRLHRYTTYCSVLKHLDRPDSEPSILSDREDFPDAAVSLPFVSVDVSDGVLVNGLELSSRSLSRSASQSAPTAGR